MGKDLATVKLDPRSLAAAPGIGLLAGTAASMLLALYTKVTGGPSAILINAEVRYASHGAPR